MDVQVSVSITLLQNLPSTLHQSMGTENNNNDLRVASFSCYLKPIEDVVNMLEASEKFTDTAVLNPHSNKQKSSSKRWFHGCAGPCSTKKAVYVKQSIKKGDQFTFPVMINPTIEVFSSGSLNKGNTSKNLVRKMSILAWDAIPKSKESVFCDDMTSEASSDLFEIENVSRSGWQPSESCCLSRSTRCATSEASVEWSVVTASAAEFSSVYLGYD